MEDTKIKDISFGKQTGTPTFTDENHEFWPRSLGSPNEQQQQQPKAIYDRMLIPS